MTVIVRQIAAGADDGVWNSAPSFSSTGINVQFGWTGYTENIFARFLNIRIPQGAPINSAKLSFKASLDRSVSVVNAIISAIDEDNADAPTSYSEAENATRTSASVAWNAVGSWTEDTWYDSPDLTAIIQEIVDRPGFQSGYAIVLYIEDNASSQVGGCFRMAHGFESAAAESIMLTVDFDGPIAVEPSESVTVGDTPSLALADLAVSVSQSVGVSDQPHMSPEINVSETVTVGDSPSLSVASASDLNVSVSESITVSDTPNAQASGYFINVAETVTVADDPHPAVPDKLETDTITLTDEVLVERGSSIEARNHPHTTKLYMAVKIPRVVWTGTVTTGRSRGWDGDIEDDQLIYITSGANESGFDVTNFLPDLTAWVGDDSDYRKHGKCRAREFDGSNLKVAADMGCVWEEGDKVRITDLHDLWPRPHVVQESGDDVVVYKDIDLPDTDRAERPVPIMGPPVCAFLSGGSVDVQFSGGLSYKVQPDSSEHPAGWTYHHGITDYAWWFEGGTPSTSTDPNPTVTYSTAGQYVVRLTVTGEDSNTERGFRNVFIFERVGANAPTSQFRVENLSGSLANHGWEATIEVYEDNFDPANAPSDAQVVIFAEEWFAGTARSYRLGNPGLHFRENVKMVGWLSDAAITYESGKVRGARMLIRGLQKYIQSLTNFPVYFTQIETTSPDWHFFDTTGSDGLTVRKCWYHLLRWHWTIMHFTDVFITDTHNNYLPGQNFPEGTLGSQLDAFCKDTQAKWVVDRGGALHIFDWPNWLPATGEGLAWRTAMHTGVQIAEQDFVSINVEPRVREQIARVRVEGVMADGTGWYEISVDMVPGDTRGYKGGTTVLPNQVIGLGGVEGSQGWELARAVYAEESRPIERVSLEMMGNYSHLDIAPGASHFELTVSPSQTLRDIDWTDKPFWVVDMQFRFDHEHGDLSVSLGAIPETYPYQELLVHTQFDGIDSIAQESESEDDFGSFVREVQEPASRQVPALMGNGGLLLEGGREGTTFVRLYGDMRQVVLAENRGFHEVEDRPVMVEYSPAYHIGGDPTSPLYRIVGVRPGSDDEQADTDLDRGINQHFVVFTVPGSVSVASPAAPPFIVTRFKYAVMKLHALVNTAPTGTSLVCWVKKNGTNIGSVTIGDGATSGSTSFSAGQEYVEDSDVITLHITQVGSSSPGTDLTVQVEVWAHGL